MTDSFVKQINDDYDVETDVYDSIFKQYERVVVQSLITSFGLDFLIKKYAKTGCGRNGFDC